VNINCGLEGCPEFLFNFAKLSNAVIKQVLIYTSLLSIDFQPAQKIQYLRPFDIILVARLFLVKIK
jgi:hypothetical protein